MSANIAWSNIKVFVGGVEVQGIESVTIPGLRIEANKVKRQRAITRMRTLAECIANNSINLN